MTLTRRCSAWNKSGLLLLTLLTGCHRHFFSARGQIGSDGPAFGHWTRGLMGCSRDPKDALPDAQTRTVATFIWEHPLDHDPQYNGFHDPPAPDVPMQFNVLRADSGGYDLRLQTFFTDGTLITAKDCSKLQVETHEQGPAMPGGRPSLAGSVVAECRVKESRMWADFSFERCEY